MEGIFLGQAVDGVFSIDKTKLTFEHERRTHESHSAIRYSDCDYVLVESDDVIKTNDELLKLRDKVTKLEAELTEIKTARNLREAYIAGVEKGCESLREERDRWKNRCNSVVTDIGKSLESNGIEFTLKEIHGNGNWDVVIDIPELNEAKKKVEDLEKKLKAAKSNESFWRDRKEEEEDHHYYWLHTYDRVVKQAAEKGVHIDVCGSDEECNAGVVVVDNVKAEELEKQIVQMEDANQKPKNRDISRVALYWRDTYYSAVEKAKEEGVAIVMQGMDLDRNVAHIKVMNHRTANLERRIKRLEDDNSAKANALIIAKDRGDAWMREHETLTRKYQALEAKHNAKWSAMMQALKDKGVEVLYMGEQDNKPIVDVKIPGWEADKQWVRTFSKQCADLRGDKFGLESERDELKEQCDILRKDGVLKGQQCLKLKGDLNALKKEYGRVLSELAELKSKTVAEARYEWKPGCFTLIYTMCDGSKQTISMDSSEAIDATSISCGTVPKCSSCAHYMHNPSRFAHDWCYMPVPKEGGAGYIRKLNKEEAEGPACSDFKAKE